MKPELRRHGLRCLASNNRGATAVEYGLILGLVVIVMLVALSNVADATIGKWNYVANKVSGT